jgi:DNA-binding response OmpR family regulator
MLYAGELEEEGYQVITSGECSELRDLIDKFRPDIIIMDTGVLMEISGCRSKTPGRTPLPPVILCTTLSCPEISSGDLSIDYTVVKSPHLGDLKSKIRRAAGRKPHQPFPHLPGNILCRKYACPEQIAFPWAATVPNK